MTRMVTSAEKPLTSNLTPSEDRAITDVNYAASRLATTRAALELRTHNTRQLCDTR